MVEQVEFKDFKIGELFENPQRGTRLISQNRIPGETVLITAGKENYGESTKIFSATQQLFCGENITIDMFGNVFFRDCDFFADDNIIILNGEDYSKKSLIYLTSVLSKSISGKYSYSKQFRMKELPKTTIPLPVTSSGTPDYSYMESYISYIEKLHVENIQKAHTLRIEQILKELGYNSLKDVELTQEDKEILRLFSEGGEKLTLAEFKIGELFDIIPTTTTITDSLNGGDFLTPLVSNTTTNNGIKEYVSRVPNNKGNVITFSDTTTSSDTIFYQEDDFVGYSHIQKMELKEETLNKNIAMFIISVMRKQIEGKYSWGTKFNRKNAAATVVSLPVTSSDSIDYPLMESYITAIEKLHVNKLIYSNNQEITALNTVI